ncbi:MAG: AsmA family protein, partial [Chlorobi bacterium]|nr:AsmA family protein [Chlorobiota bacterium]
MKKLLKILAVLLVLIIASLFILPIAFKSKIIEAVQEEANNNLNAKLKFADLNLSLISNFPNISAELEDLTIVGVDTFATDTLVGFKSLKATLDLMSVISGTEIKVKELILNKPNVNVKILENGLANYDIAKEDTTNTETEIDTTSSSNFKINLDKFEIIDGNITYDDLEGNMFANIENMNFTLSGDATETITNLDMNLLIDALTVKYDGIKYINKAKTTFKSDMQADLEKSKYTFKENTFKLNEVNLGFDGFVEMPTDDINIDIKFKTKDAKFKDVLSLIPAVYMTDFEDVKTSGKFNMDGYVKGIFNDKNMPAYGINLLVMNAKFQYPDLPKSVNDINVNMKVDAKEGSGDDITIDIKKASMTMANNPFKMSTLIKMTAADVDMGGNVKGKLDFNSIKDIVPLEDMKISGIMTADMSFKGKLSDIENENYEKFDAKGSMQVEKMGIIMADMPKININSADMSFAPQYVDLRKFDMTLGKSDFHLIGKIDNLFSYVFKDELLKGTFNFTSKYIDVDELMGTVDEETESSENAESTEDGIVEIPGNIDFVLNSTIDKIKYDNINITNAKGKIIIKDSKLDMQGLNMDMLGGSIVMSGSYDTKNKENPLADFNMKINNFNIAEVSKTFLSVKKIAPIIENCMGDFSADMSFKSLLDKEMMPVVESIMSSGDINSNNITIKDSKIFNLLASKTKQNKFKSPRVESLNLKYFIDKGNLNIDPTDFKIAGSKVTFGGTQSVDQKLDFNLGMLLPKNVAGNLLSKLPIGNSDEDVDVTARIGGTAEDPKIVGFTSSVTDILKDDVQEKVDDAKDKVNAESKKILDDAQKQADKIIKTAEEQADNIRKEAKKAGDKLIK